MRDSPWVRRAAPAAIIATSLAACWLSGLAAWLLRGAAAVLKELGISRPELVLLPVVLIGAWILIDIALVLVGFRVKDKERTKREALRARLLSEEFSARRPEDVEDDSDPYR